MWGTNNMVIIVYDEQIPATRSLTKVRLLKSQGNRVQHSAFRKELNGLQTLDVRYVIVAHCRGHRNGDLERSITHILFPVYGFAHHSIYRPSCCLNRERFHSRKLTAIKLISRVLFPTWSSFFFLYLEFPSSSCLFNWAAQDSRLCFCNSFIEMLHNWLWQNMKTSVIYQAQISSIDNAVT